MTPIEKDLAEQLAEIKAMWFKNTQAIAEYWTAEVDKRTLTKDQFKSLVRRTEMLKDVIEYVESQPS